MRDLDKALADILTIRAQLAAGTAFQGYGPGAVGATGLLALVATGVQHARLGAAAAPLSFFGFWIAVAVVAVGIIGTEMVARTWRQHSGLADEMLRHAAEQMLPAGVVGALLLGILWRFAPDELWLLPGLWQILVGLGIFASLRILPRSMGIAAGFYVLAGLVVVALAAQTRTLSPLAMGLPFAAGQLLVAAILHLASDTAHDAPHDAA